MATRAQMRADVRTELGDTVAAYVWSDALLNEYIEEGIRELTYLVPLGGSASVAVAANQRGYVLPGVYLVERVECPRGTFVARDQGGVPDYTGAADLPDSGYEQAWAYRVQDRTLIFRNPPPAGETIMVTYQALRVPVSDDVTAQPVSDEDLPLVVLYACVAAWEERRVEDSKRGQRTPGLGNPYRGRFERALARRRRQLRSGRLG